jgi:hypothetical protein
MASDRDRRVSERLGSPTGILTTMPTVYGTPDECLPNAASPCSLRLKSAGRNDNRSAHNLAELGDAAEEVEAAAPAHRLP